MPQHQCHYCEEQPPTQQLLLRHVKLVHSQEPGFTISCDYCHRVFRNFRTYQNHLLSHKNSTEHDQVVTAELSFETNEIINETRHLNEPHSQVVPDFTNYCAQWILKTGETRRLTRTATLGIVHDVSDLIKEVSVHLEEQVKCFLQRNQIIIQDDCALSMIFSEANPTVCPFSNLMSFH